MRVLNMQENNFPTADKRLMPRYDNGNLMVTGIILGNKLE